MTLEINPPIKKFFINPLLAFFNFFKNLFTKHTLDTSIISAFIIIMVFLIIVAYFTGESKVGILFDFQSGECINPDDTTKFECYYLNGIIVENDKPVEGAVVWLIIQGESGSETYSSPVTAVTDTGGVFRFNPIKKYFEKRTIDTQKRIIRNVEIDTTKKEVDTNDFKAQKSIDVGKEEKGKGSSISKEAVNKIIVKVRIEEDEIEEVNLELSKSDQIIKRISTQKINVFEILYLPVLFVFSLLFPIVLKSNKAKYLCSISAAIFFSAGMIITIAIWVSYVSEFDPNRTLSLGFLHFSFSNDLKDWVLSLSSPAKLQEKGGSGFWVPIWVMMLSVIGSSLYTILLILKQITEIPKIFQKGVQPKVDNSSDQSANKEFTDLLEKIVRHQFYILFSPLGSIFVYQLLIMGDAAKNQTTVAITALASGIVLNSILAKALELTEKLIGGVKTNETQSNGNKTGEKTNVEKRQCKESTKKGKQCKRDAEEGSDYCRQHKK